MKSSNFAVPSEPEDQAGLLFYQALQQNTELRATFLASACGENEELRAEVESLLQDHDRAGQFLTGITRELPEAEKTFPQYLAEQTGDLIGPYKLLEKLGEGGFGVVWMADQKQPVRRRVALKVIKLGMDTRQVMNRFEAERQALALMDHPNIAKVYDAGATGSGRPYFVMELVRGIPITAYCDQNHLPTSQRLTLFIQVCLAIQHAHQKGIIHRDIKPSNILVTLHDGVPVPKVIDFGIAKATTGQELTDKTIFTAFEQFIGTPAYMSPEQAEMSGLDIDTRSDIYALGVLLYELLTGRTPFDAKELLASGLDAMRRTIREQEPMRPSTRLSTLLAADQTTVATLRQSNVDKLSHLLRGDLDWIVMKALEKDRTRRYENAHGLAADIQRNLNNEPVLARPPGKGYRLRKFVRRNRLLVGTSITLLTVLLGGIGMSAWQGMRANAALRELRSSAPAFASLARTLAGTEKFEEAIGNLDVAIRLRPDLPEYILFKADLLESQLRFSEAVPLYRQVMQMDPGEKRAELNAKLCEKLSAEITAGGNLSRSGLVSLYEVMVAEQRPAAELLRAARLLGKENKILLHYWRERLRNLPIPSGPSLPDRLVSGKRGNLKLNLSGTAIADLTLLEGMPLEQLALDGCEQIKSLEPLRGMPLRELSLSYMSRDDGVGLDFSRKPCPVSDLQPLLGMPLEKLNLGGTYVNDLSALAGMPLQDLSIFDTGVHDLSPLKGMPLRRLSCDRISCVDFSPLAGAPLSVLSLESTPVGDLAFLRDMPLKELYLKGCGVARGFSVLSGLQDLDHLCLPDDFMQLPKEEVAAVEALRNHPNLKVIGPGDFSGRSRSSKEEFWKSYDLLKMVGGNRDRIYRQASGWQINFDDIPLKSLAPLHGMTVTALRITGAGITDLTPLKGMPLRSLYAGSNPMSSLEPLGQLPLTHVFLDGCPADLDVSPLGTIKTLQSVVLPPQARNVATLRQLPELQYLSEQYHDGYDRALQTTSEFWNKEWPVTPESHARKGNYAAAERLLRENMESTPGYSHIALATVVFAQRDKAAWQAYCKQALDWKSDMPVEKHAGFFALRACLLGPDCGVPAADIEALTITLKKQWNGETFFSITEGLQQFRAGKLERAQNIMIRVRDISSLPHAKAACTTVLAMIRCAEGQLEYARQTLQRAQEEMRGKWPDRARTSIWYEWLTVHLLLKEAEEMIQDVGLINE